ncbi:MAG TPA: glycosyl transferase family 2 [Thermoplasmatales archaeon]|nr:glycosyl transferase family 2 [Thermoplasmatales archaeon]
MGRESTYIGSVLEEKCRRIKPVDILVGVLCKNVETTILHVLNVVNEGLYGYFPEYRKAIAVSVGSPPGTDRTFELAEMFQPYNSIAKIITEDIGGKGKGAGIRTVLEIAHQLDAKIVVLVDGDLLSIRPKWMESIAGPILYGRADLTIPYYIRHKYDGVITNILAYPFTRALYGVDIRQPIAGEFGLSKTLYEKLLDHPLFPYDFGIDIFIVTVAAAEGLMPKESLFTMKIHESTTRYLEPEKLLIPMFRQVTGKMFELAHYYENVWKYRERKGRNGFYRESFGQKPIPVKVDLKKLEKNFKHDVMNLRDVIQRFLPEDLVKKLEKTTKDTSKFDADLWAKIVYNFAASYKLLGKSVDRYVLLEAFKPLWLGRFVSYAIEVKDMEVNEAERVIHHQAEVFEDNFGYLVSIY